MDPSFVLVHSPLVGPLTWAPVADQLRQSGHDAFVPALTTDPEDRPYWKQHARAVGWALARQGEDRRVILVGHSGAGPLLPAVRQETGREAAAYLFVDANLPRDGASRLDLIPEPDEAEAFRMMAEGGFLPTWRDVDLRDVILDDDLRARFVAELRPLPLAVYEEPLPVFDGWPDAPCAYLRFSPPYETSFQQAQDGDWPCRELEGGHFYMLVDPPAVARTLVEMAVELGALS